MPSKIFFSVSAILLAAVMVAIAGAQSPSPNSPASSSPPQTQQQQSPQSGNVLRVKTHVVTVDVVATDSHGNAVRDLKPGEFTVPDNGPQKIAHFTFIDKSASTETATLASAAQPHPKGFYTNQAAFAGLAAPPTVLLVDALNTMAQAQAVAHSQMVRLITMLPAGTPVAVLTLNDRLVLLQDFTTDPALLRSALDRSPSRSALLETDPQLDPDSVSNAHVSAEALNHINLSSDPMATAHADFNKEVYEKGMTARVDITTSALEEIADYLRGYPGRKNLIWLSSSFPLSLFPRLDYGSAFAGTADYSAQVQRAANALSDAQVAVNPVNPEGLLPVQPNMTALNDSVAKATMQHIAEDTGGRTCINTNDLSGCVRSAVEDSSSYYELAYYPETVKWDGSFHSISLKTTRPGVKLTYRRGYYALDEGALAKQQPPDTLLEQACRDLLPSTGIPLAAQAIPSGNPDKIRYLMSVAPGALSIVPDGQLHKLSARMATCVYSGNGASFRFTTRDLSRSLSDADSNSIETGGLHGYLDAPKAGTVRVRIAVLDLGTGLTGALDIDVHPEDFENAAVPPAAPTALPPESASPAQVPENPPSLPVYSIGFHSSSGTSSALDWNGDKLSYIGDIGVAQTAPVYFHDAFGAMFQCEDGELIPRNASDQKPDLHFSFANPAGHTAVVDLTGSEPQYSGDLPVDPTAKPFFERLWYLCHCRAGSPSGTKGLP
ncbi:MAG: VWA domain-containing protein [Candidatus Acidiferrales bacterium]